MPEPSSTTPTVIVARKVRQGREAEFRDWHEQIRAAASAFPGYVNSELQPPDVAHPGEWVTVYSFSNVGELDAWLASEERGRFAAAAAELLEGPVREQRIAALRTAPEPVTVVFSQRIEPGSAEAFRDMFNEAVALMSGFPGFLGAELLPPVTGVQEEHVVVASFASRRELDAWLESDSRRLWIEAATSLIEGERTINVVGGFGGWFPAAPDRPDGPKRWKQAIAVLLALYPTSLAITAIRSEIAPDMNMVLAVFIANVLGVAALTFFLMPLVTGWLSAWLSR